MALWLFELPSGACADWFSGFWSAAAVVVAVGSYGFGEWRAARSLRAQERSFARQIGLKLFRLFNEAHDIMRNLKPINCPPDTSILNFHYREVHPLVGMFFDPDLRLEAQEIDVIVKAGDSDFMPDLMLAFSRHRTIVDCLNEYKVRYEALHSMMPTPVEAEGTAMTYSMDKSELLKIAPYGAALDHLLNAIIGMVRENVVLAERLSEQYTLVMKKALKVDKWMELILKDRATP